jgi:hypothetical protein
MTQQPFEQDERQLTQVYEGMGVYDTQGKKIGTVRHVYLGAVTEEEDDRGLGPATVSSPERSEHSLIEDFMRAVSPHEPVPDPLRQRLLRHGFIRINASGLFTSDRYAMPDQIASVADDRITLRVAREDLMKH